MLSLKSLSSWSPKDSASDDSTVESCYCGRNRPYQPVQAWERIGPVAGGHRSV